MGYADLWLKAMFYKVLLAGDIAEEQFDYYQIITRNKPGSGLWYVGSVITSPELRTHNFVKSAYVFKSLFNEIYSALVATPYPARVMGVGSSEFGKKLLHRHGFELIEPSLTAKDLRPRYEKVLQALELATEED